MHLDTPSKLRQNSLNCQTWVRSGREFGEVRGPYRAGSIKDGDIHATSRATGAKREDFMISEELRANIQDPGIAKTANDRPLSMSAETNKENRRARSSVSRRKIVISIAVIDEKSLTRQCIINSLKALDERLEIVSFATCDDYLQSMTNHDVILYYTHGATEYLENNLQKFVSFKRILTIAPVIVLSDTDRPDSIVEAVESGARGFIPTADTTLEQIIEIIGFVRVGGIFVPSSSLTPRNTRVPGLTARGVTDRYFTPTETAVLDRLKLGKANKVIAHELGVSESTVKVHIGRIMKKLKATNRTQVVCRAYALPAASSSES
jgi:DNA-binding NarL/FixJ family response regulator